MFHCLVQAAQNAGAAISLDAIDKIVKVIAVILGGIWTYLNYVRGRTYKRRLEPKISGKIVPGVGAGALMVIGTAQTKNVGLSKVDIEASGTAVIVADMVPGKSARGVAKIVEASIPGGVLGVFEKHGWLEPGETIDESFAVPLPPRNDRAAVRLRLRIVSRHWLFKNIEWNADAIAELPPPPGTAPAVTTTAPAVPGASSPAAPPKAIS